MVHPIAGRNQYPFTINGIIVDGAKIDGNTYVKDLFIHKQRSYNIVILKYLQLIHSLYFK